MAIGAFNHLAESLGNGPDDFIYLLDKQGVGNIGVGHSAMLIQASDGKWYYVSKAGTNTNGKADIDDAKGRAFNSPEEFFNSTYGQRYESFKRISLDLTKSQEVLDGVRTNSITKYNVYTNNCTHMCQVGLDIAGIPHNGSRIPVSNFNSIVLPSTHIPYSFTVTDNNFR